MNNGQTIGFPRPVRHVSHNQLQGTEQRQKLKAKLTLSQLVKNFPAISEHDI